MFCSCLYHLMLTRLAIKVLTLMSQLSINVRQVVAAFFALIMTLDFRLHMSAAHVYADIICTPTRSRGLKHHAGTNAGMKADWHCMGFTKPSGHTGTSYKRVQTTACLQRVTPSSCTLANTSAHSDIQVVNMADSRCSTFTSAKILPSTRASHWSGPAHDQNPHRAFRKLQGG